MKKFLFFLFFILPIQYTDADPWLVKSYDVISHSWTKQVDGNKIVISCRKDGFEMYVYDKALNKYIDSRKDNPVMMINNNAFPTPRDNQDMRVMYLQIMKSPPNAVIWLHVDKGNTFGFTLDGLRKLWGRTSWEQSPCNTERKNT